MVEPSRAVRVEVVDGDPLVRDELKRLLTDLRCEVAEWERGEDCLAGIISRKPDLVLMDLRLPGRAGDDCCRAIKETADLGGTAVIIFTAADAAHEVMRSWRAGADDFLPKPIRGRQLETKIQAIREATGRSPPVVKAGAPKVLFVDDSRFFRTVLGSALEHSGFQVLYAKSGDEALELVEREADGVDTVVSDLVMPGVDGLELARRLRARPGTERTPLLLLTAAGANADQLAEARTLTDHPLLDKRELPVEAILTKINTALRRVPTDLRAAERVPFFSVVEFRSGDDKEWLSGFSYDVSAGGIFVRSITPLPANTPVELRVKFTFRPSAKTASGVVVWANPFHARTSWCSPVGMGVRFTWLDAEDREAVAKLVKGARPA